MLQLGLFFQMQEQVERGQETGRGYAAGRRKKDVHGAFCPFQGRWVLSVVVHRMSQENAQDSFYCLVSEAELWFEKALPKFLKRKHNPPLQPCLGGSQVVGGALELGGCLPSVSESCLCQA